MIDQTMAELEAIMERCPDGYDEYGVWTPWSEEMKLAALKLMAEIRGVQYRFQHQAEIDVLEAKLAAERGWIGQYEAELMSGRG